MRRPSAVDHADLTSEMWNGGAGHTDGLHRTDFNTTSGDDLTDGNSWGETSFTYTTPDGTIVNGRHRCMSAQRPRDVDGCLVR